MEPKFRPYTPWPSSDKDAHALFENFETALQTRRSLRMYSKKQVFRTTVERLISLAASAPSGANKQPWHFVAVQNPEVKRRIREAAEEEEKAFYGGRATEEWLQDLKPFATDWEKPFFRGCALAHRSFPKELRCGS